MTAAGGIAAVGLADYTRAKGQPGEIDEPSMVGVARTTKSGHPARKGGRIAKIEPAAARGQEVDVFFAGSLNIEDTVAKHGNQPVTTAPLAISTKLPDPLANNVPESATVPLTSPLTWRGLECCPECIATAGSPSCTAPGDCSPAITAIGLPMRANRNWHSRACCSQHADAERCFRLERLPGGICTHWKAPPFHGARRKRTFAGDPELS